MPVKAVAVRFTLVLSLGLFVACGGKATVTAAAACAADGDCKVGSVCIDKACQVAITCDKLQCNASARQGCQVVNKQAACVNLGCRTSTDCSPPQVCVASACTTQPATADSCEITNRSRVVAASGAAVQITAVGYDAKGQAVPYLVVTSVAVDDGSKIAVAGTSVAAGSAAGSATVTATITGGKTCTATFTNVGASVAGTFRVYLYEANGSDAAGAAGSTPVAGLAGALALYDATSGAPLGASFTESATAPGVYAATGPAGATFSFAGNADYAPITVVGVPASNELSLPLSHLMTGQSGKIAGFGGQPDMSKYTAKFTTPSPLTAVIASASIPPSSLLSLDLSLFTGDSGAVALSATTLLGSGACTVASPPPAGTLPAGQVALPRLVYLDNKGSPKGANCAGYAARALPGPRVAWSLGTQLNISALLQNPAITPLLAALGGSGSSGLSIAAVLPAVLPLLSGFASGVNAIPVTVPSGKQSLAVLADAALWTAFAQLTGFAKAPIALNSDFPRVDVTPGLPLGNVVNFPNPGLDLDPAPGANGAHFDVAGTLILAQSPTFGLVPLGLGAGLDVIDKTKAADGAFDTLNPKDPVSYPPNVIYTRYSSPDTAVSDADIIAVTIETNLADLTAKTGQISDAIRIRGNVTRSSAKLGWSDSAPAIDSLTTANTNVAFITYPAAPKYSYVGGNKLVSPPLTVGTGVTPDMVFMQVSSTAGSVRVLVDPATITPSHNTVAIPATNIGQFGEAVSFTTVAIKFRNGRTFADLASQHSGIDFETLAGDMVSIAAYSQSTTVAP